MRTTGVTKVTKSPGLAGHSRVLLATIGLLVAGFLLSPTGYDLMFRLGAQTGTAIFAWVDGDHTEGTPPR